MRYLVWLLTLYALLPQYQLDSPSSLVDFGFKSFKPKLDLKNFHPKIPKHIKLHIAAAFPEKEFQTYSKVFNKTLSSISSSFLIVDSQQRYYNVTVQPIFFVLPASGRFSSSIYEVMCSSFESKRVAAIFVVGETPAAFTVAMAATTSNVPVVWARGEQPSPVGSLQHTDSLEVRVEPAESHLMEAVRAVFIATHWHTFTVMARPNLASRSAHALDLDPLHPKVVPITQNSHSIFRRLADVSRATRGVVLLVCDVAEAKRVMDVAKRLNMMDGHFVWLWIDTTAKPASFLSSPPTNHTLHLQQTPRRQSPFTSRIRRNVSLTERKKRPINLAGNAATDYLSDLAEGDDDSEETDDEDEDENEGEDSSPPQSKAWGKITELFPLRNSANHDKEATFKDTNLPLGMLAIKPEPVLIDRHLVKGSVRLLVSALHTVLKANADWISALDSDTSCWQRPTPNNKNFSVQYAMELRRVVRNTLSGDVQFQEGDRADRSLLGSFKILNLVPEKFNINFQNDASVLGDAVLAWRQVGRVTGRIAHLDTIVWPGGDLVASALSARTRSVFRIVTALAPPFVMEGALDEDGQCLRGVICHRVLNSDKDNLTLVFNEMDTQERQEEEEEELGGDEKTERPLPNSAYHEYSKHKYKSSCCYGLAMDLLENVAQELQFEFHLYIAPDGYYGAATHVWDENHGSPRQKWNGLVGDLVSGAAHMSFASLSVSKARSRVIDFSTPFFFGGVSMLAAPAQRSEVPLLAFLLPFSPELWIAIFTSLNITAMAVACYEWLSPFGLNPWGRQRSRNFSIASALWVCWGLLCGHLVAFKAPKSWPNKFLINVWGGFSVIFVASYTANIAALIAGLFFHNSSDYYDNSLLTQRVGAPKSSAAEYYINLANPHLSEHMRKYTFKDVETGIALLKNGSLDILVADTPILDYYRMTDHGCKLKKIFDSLNDDTYAIGMNKGFPLKESISAVISKYNNNGYVDILKEKWYGGLPCYKMAAPIDVDLAQPRPLGVAAVAGVFLLLGLGMFVGVLILILEHLFYRYTLPILRHKPKGTIWRSRNIMFFSQKLYRFINCVELVSPHHAARELVHTLRQGQITSLFQKSVRRKEHEQRRRRKSKAQFFEMIQEIRRAQKEERYDNQLAIQQSTEGGGSPRSPLKSFLTSPRSLKQAFTKSVPTDDDLHQRRTARSASRLDIRRFSKELFSLPRSPRSPNDKSMTSLESEGRFSARESSAAIGRRLSKDTASWLTSSPPDMNTRRRSHLDITHTKSLTTEDTSADQSKYLTLSHVNLPVISQTATLRLAGSDVKVRPRLASPPRSPVLTVRNMNTPKINISDASVYDSIVPEKPKSHNRSKSLDNKPLNLTLVEFPITPSSSLTTNTVTSSAKNNEKQTVNYATLEHKVALKTIKNNTKPNENGNDKCSYSEMTQSQKQVLLKQTKNEDKPHLPPKNNALKQIQTRAYSAPESFRSHQPTVIFIPDESMESKKKGFETFPKEKRHQGHQSRYDASRCGSVGRSSSVPEQRYIISAADCLSRSDGAEHKRHREGPIVSLQHSSQPSSISQKISSQPPQSTRNASNSSHVISRSSHNVQHETPKKSQAATHPVVARSSGSGPSSTKASICQSTPQRTTQYYSSQSFDGDLPRTPYNAVLFETPVTHGRSFDVPPRNSHHQHSSPKTPHHSNNQETPRFSLKPSLSKSSHTGSQQEATKKGFAHHADVIRTQNSEPIRSVHTSVEAQKPPCGASCHAASTPARSSSHQSSSVKSPKRVAPALQYTSKSVDAPPRSSSLHPQVLPVVTSARTSGLQYAASAEGTPTRTPGILKNKRRSRSRDFDSEGAAAPASPRDNTDAQSREILLTIRRQTQGYMKPP